MTTNQIKMYRECENAGEGHIANVIVCQCGNKSKKLAGLVKLLRSGASVKLSQFDLFAIVVNGERHSIEYLETV